MANKKPLITLSEPYPLLDPGKYIAQCVEADYAWARQWKKWMVRLILKPFNYSGRPYTGKLCKFLSLGKNPERPCAGHHSHFRQLLVEVNGDQPVSTAIDVAIFHGCFFEITVETVTKDRNGKDRAPPHHYSVVRDIHFTRPPPQPLNLKPINPLTYQPSNRPTQQHCEHTPAKREGDWQERIERLQDAKRL